MSLDLPGLLAVVQGHAMATGYFDAVLLHEPKSAPGNGLWGCVWMDSARPVADISGLDSASILVVVNVQLRVNMLQEPQDATDSGLWTAVDALMSAYIGDFDLGGNARNVDVFGSYGSELSAKYGYLNQDGTLYRVVDITVPVLINDVWNEAA